MEALSQRQKDVLIQIELVKAQGFEPCISSLARHIGLSYQRTRTLLLELETKGYIKTVAPIKGVNRISQSKKYVVINPILTNRETFCVSGDDLTLDDIKGNIIV
jgi:DNA-binding IscR family transcriptional regulator